MFVLNKTMDCCQNYYHQTPSDTFSKVARSAIYSFVINLLIIIPTDRSIAFNLMRPLRAGGVAALASLVYAFTNPFFNMAFGDNRILAHREYLKLGINAVLTSVTMSYLTAGKVDIIAFNFMRMFPVNLLLGILEMGPVTLEWVGDTVLANQVRAAYKFLGIDAVPGMSSVCIV